MFCKNCGIELGDGNFCIGCGVPVGQGDQYCADCGAAMMPGVDGCPVCSKAAAPVAEPVVAAQPVVTVEAPVAETVETNEDKKGNMLALIAMICGIVSASSWMCCLSFIGFPAGVAAIILSVVCMIKKMGKKPFVIVGLITGIVGALFCSINNLSTLITFMGEGGEFFEEFFEDLFYAFR